MKKTPKTCRADQLALKFLRAATQIQGALDADLAPFDLSMQQLKVLSILADCEGRRSNVGHIKSQMNDPNSNVSRLLNKLMDKHLIEKKRDVDDQRVVHIQLTGAGLSALKKGKSVMDQHFAKFDQLSPAQAKTLEEVLALLR
ncbi:MarR family winged helix-turn-helix transcriptional regulator [Maritalea myrionectae]|uniref:MarR family winged helix-turn-helix transcriptional regulator n=1 Tax=Maritalea myrionectae TaxID=454601 RepID=UPI0003FCC5BE|nr:MarR family transcriptional regulator [Maritalea myrionectae]